MKADSAMLDDLWMMVVGRREERPDNSYVVTLLDGGHELAGAKVTEEAAELVEAAAEDDVEHIVHEAADLLFHTWVLLATTNADPDAVYAELHRRFGTSGLTEKASRGGTKPGDEN